MSIKHLTFQTVGLGKVILCTSLFLAGGAMAEQTATDADAVVETETDAIAEIDTEMMEHGETIYQTYCAACHGETGRGTDGGPPLANSSNLGDTNELVKQTLDGGEYMPGFAFLFTDTEIAAVSTYIRNTWENDFGPVTEQQVLDLR